MGSVTAGVDLSLIGPDSAVTVWAGDGRTMDGVDIVATGGTVNVELEAVGASGLSTVRGIVARGWGTTSITVGYVGSSGQGILATEENFAKSGPPPVVGGVSVTAGRVSTSGPGAGIFASSSNGGVLVDVGELATLANGSPGLVASAAAGEVKVAAGSVGTSGANSAAISASGRDIDVVTGNITTWGESSPGVLATGDTVTVVSTGEVTTAGAQSHGFDLTGTNGPVSLDINDVHVTGSGAQAVRVGSTEHNTVTVRGLVQSAQDFAVDAVAGASSLQIAENGSVLGRVDLSPDADVVHNWGVFDAIGTSFFHGGDDHFSNTGVTRAVNGQAVLDSVDAFNSSGRIQMNDGAADDRLTIGGDFTGSGQSLLVTDVDYTTRTADLLVTGAATGSTSIELETTGQNAGLLGATPIMLVDGATGTSPTAFSLAGGSVSISPYVTQGLVFDPAGFDFLLVNAPSQSVFDAATFSEAIEQSPHSSADAVIAQLDLQRDSRGEGRFDGLVGGSALAIWGQVHRGERTRGARQEFGGTAIDTSYTQDGEGYQAGLGIHSDALAIGFTAGASDSTASFSASRDRLDVESRNLGIYGQFFAGGPFANLLAQVSWIDGATSQGGGGTTGFDAIAKSLRGTVGYRWGLEAVWLEPAASLSWTDLDIDPFVSGGATLQLAEGSALRGMAGFRVGGDLAAGGGILTPVFSLQAVASLAGRHASTFTYGSTIVMPQTEADVFGRTSFELGWRSGTVTLFARAELEFGQDVRGHGGRAGVQLRF
jgi:hypothetical protein